MTVIRSKLFNSLLIKSGLLLLALSMCLPAAAANITWAIVISPAGGGTVQWQTSKPVKSGVFSKTGKLVVEEGAYVDLTFQVNEGFTLERVMKNLDDWTPWLDGSKHYKFGPVSKAHAIVATFAEINPTGSLKFETPALLPADVAPIYNATGHYSGTLPIGHHRTFDAYAAMDESGKVDILPNVSTLEGYTSDPANKPVSGVLKTIDNKPEIKVSGKLAGTRDGVAGDISGSGSLGGIEALPAELPLSIEAATANALSGAGEQLLDAAAVAGYKVQIKNKQTGVKLNLTEKALPITLPVTTNVTREWSVTVTLQQRADAKQKKKVYAKALLTLPTGDQVSFAERIVKYSRKSGYNLSFVKGNNLSTGKVDKKTSLTIKKMLFSCAKTPCTLNDGEMQYGFLGQKGKAKLMDFLTP